MITLGSERMVKWNLKVRWPNVQLKLISLCMCLLHLTHLHTHLSHGWIPGWHQCPTGEVRDKRSERHEGDQLLEAFLHRRSVDLKTCAGHLTTLHITDRLFCYSTQLSQHWQLQQTLLVLGERVHIIVLLTNCLRNSRALVYPRLQSGHLPVGLSSAERRTEKLRV